MNCGCEECNCCRVKVAPGHSTCPACRLPCGGCGGKCKTHLCKCQSDGPPHSPNPSDPSIPGHELDPYAHITIYDNDDNWIPYEESNPDYNEMNPGGFVMQYFEGNDIIENKKLNRVYLDFFPTDSGDDYTIERINDKIKLWRPEYNSDWEVINKRHENIFENSSSRSFNPQDFYGEFNDVQYACLWVEGVEPGVSGLKSYINGALSDEVKIL